MITYNDIYEAAENLLRVSHTSSNQGQFIYLPPIKSQAASGRMK
jgi:hypothetical protein